MNMNLNKFNEYELDSNIFNSNPIPKKINHRKKTLKVGRGSEIFLTMPVFSVKELSIAEIRGQIFSLTNFNSTA